MKRNDTATTGKNFVPPVEPTQAPTRPAPTVELVSGKVLDNLWGGVGVAVALSAIYALLRIGLANVGMMPLPGWQHAAWAGLVFALIGVVAFGMLTAWRASLDERERQGDIDSMVERIEDDAEYIESLEERIAAQETTIANLRQDLAERMMLQQRAEMKAAQRATYTPSVEAATEPVDSAIYRDARLLVERACRNQPYSKDKVCAMFGWSQSQWRAAHQLAQDAAIFRVVGNRTELLVDDLNTALSIMDVYAGFQSVGQTD